MNVHLLSARYSRARKLFATDSLFRNATYFMTSTAIMSVLGFVFWIFVAHLYTPAQIGVASALIAITTLLSNLSLLGLNAGLIRFLPTSKNQSRDINAATIVVATVTLLAAAVYVLISTKVGGSVSLLTAPWHKVAFVVLMVTVSVNSLTDAVFISNRRGEYHTLGYTTFGIVKLILPLLLIPYGAIGIFGAYIFAVIASLMLSYYLMWRGCGYRFWAKPDWRLLKRTRAYATHNYIGVVVAGLPSQLMPLFIIKDLGASSVAYFSMAWTMANLLYIVPSAAMQSLLAESSHNPQRQVELVRRTIKILTLLLVPAVTLAILIAPYLLRIFGVQYQQHGTAIFRIMALSTFFVAITAIGNTVLNIERRTRGIVGVQVATLLVTFAAAVTLRRFGLAGIGLAMLLGNVASSIVYAGIYQRRRRSQANIVKPVAATFPNSPSALRRFLAVYAVSDFRVTELNNGSNNSTLLITSETDRRVLRIYKPGERSDEHIEQEINFMIFLAKQGLPIPTVRANKYGHRLSHIRIAGIDWQFIVMDFVTGSHPDGYSQAWLPNMAYHHAQLHLSGLDYADSPLALPSTTRPNRTSWWKQTFLKNVGTQGYSHFDYDASNLLVSNGKIISILDFEGMRYGPLISCIYFTLTRIYDHQPDTALVASYLAHYQRVRKLHWLEKLIINLSLAFRYRNPRFLVMNGATNV